MSSSTAKITVIIVDDHDWVRFALKAGLENEVITCIGEAKNASQAISLCDKLHPDALIFDMKMPDSKGGERIPDILDVSPETKVIAISAFADSSMVKKALENGAVSFVSKDSSLKELRQAITTNVGN